MRRLIRWVIFLGLCGLVAFWFLTRPKFVNPAEMAGLEGDAARGELVFYAGGCASCHSAPKAEGPEKLKLGGGRAFPSPFGTFYAPNISPSENGLKGWSATDLASAMIHGTSPDGAHYFPAFPYTSYARAELQDVVDLKAFMDELEPVDVVNAPHDVPFPFNVRRGLGLWKILFLSDDWFLDTGGDAQLERGRYLVEGLGHCTECHTSRNALGGLKRDLWMSGAPNPDGPGRIPNVTPHEEGLGGWSAADIEEYLNSGFTPEFDVAGGHMADVVQNTGQLSGQDRSAIAAYLKALPALPTAR